MAGRVLWGKTRADRLVWKRVLGAIVYDVAYSPTGDEIAAAGHDGSIYLLDVRTSEVRVLRGHLPYVATLAWSADGGRLASAGSDKTIRLWEVASGRLLATLEGHSAPLNDLAFSPDGQLLASASHDCSIRLWRVQNGELLQRIETPGSLTWVLAFSPDGSRLFAGDRDDALRVFALVDGKLEQRLRVAHPGGGVAALDISRSGRWLATGGNQQVINLWDLADLGPEARPSPSS